MPASPTTSAARFGVAWFVVAGAGVVATTLALLDIGPVQLAPSGSVAARTLVLCVQCRHVPDQPVGAAAGVPGRADLPQRARAPHGRGDLGPGHVLAAGRAPAWRRPATPSGSCPSWSTGPPGSPRSRAGWCCPGHSQGSVLVAATVLQLPPEAKPQTALLTYGSPLARLYQRAFPNYFGPKVMDDIAGSVAVGQRARRAGSTCGGRPTPSAAPVGIGDRRLADPIDFDPLPGERLAPAVAAHSGYQVTAQFEQAMSDLVGLLPTMVAPGGRATPGPRHDIEPRAVAGHRPARRPGPPPDDLIPRSGIHMDLGWISGAVTRTVHQIIQESTTVLRVAPVAGSIPGGASARALRAGGTPGGPAVGRRAPTRCRRCRGRRPAGAGGSSQTSNQIGRKIAMAQGSSQPATVSRIWTDSRNASQPSRSPATKPVSGSVGWGGARAAQVRRDGGQRDQPGQAFLALLQRGELGLAPGELRLDGDDLADGGGLGQQGPDPVDAGPLGGQAGVEVDQLLGDVVGLTPTATPPCRASRAGRGRRRTCSEGTRRMICA